MILRDGRLEKKKMIIDYTQPNNGTAGSGSGSVDWYLT
jgi:hypothetical protein